MVDSNIIYTDDELFKQYGYVKRSNQPIFNKIWRKLKHGCFCSASTIKNTLKSIFPISLWLPNYNFKQSIVGDITAGLTVGIVHIPQGMAYALLASLPPITGLYSSFFPVLVYAIFATSRHLSIGTFAVVSLMISAVIEQRVPVPSCFDINIATNISDISSTTLEPLDMIDCQLAFQQRKIQIAVALCLSVSIIHFIMFVLRLGIITVYLSTYMVSAFTCGAALHVMTSQVAKLIGVTVKSRTGYFSIIYTYVDIIKNILEINWTTFLTSFFCLATLFIGKEINLKFKKRLPFPIPWELVVVISATIASYYGMLNFYYNVSVVGNIPQGIQPSLPQVSDIGLTFVDALPISIVIFSVSISLSQMFAAKHKYDINANQELLAYSLSNLVSCFFCCFPAAPSLSRSSIWDDTGGTTQVTGIISALVILIVLIWIGPLFESLPQACLAAVIVVNLKSLLLQFKEIKPLYRVCKSDALVWIVTWVSVVLLGVDVGLICGVGISLMVVIYKSQIIKGYSMIKVGDTDLFRNSSRFQGDEINNIKIFKFDGPLYFANIERFKTKLFLSLDLNSFKKILDEKRHAQPASNDILMMTSNDNTSNSKSNSSSTLSPQMYYLILNMEACGFIDGDGVKMIKTIYTHLLNLNIYLLFANCNDEVSNCLKINVPNNNTKLPSNIFFVSVLMAIKHVKINKADI